MELPHVTLVFFTHNVFVNKNPLTEIFCLGLVRMNYSGQWTVKDVWETAGWQPKDDQLSWQSYEVLASVNSDLEAFEKSIHHEEKNETDSEQQLECAISNDTSSTNGVLEATTPQVLANKPEFFSKNNDVTRLSSSSNSAPSPKGREGLRLTSHQPPPPPPSPSAAAITRKLTSQISDRQRPVISNIQVI